MEQTQIEDLVAELETRVDRLRSLYEQYFMGIEKMEPLVPKKDVERRFQAMRREQIRNTALRFRFHMVLQKYNTYQSYWMRIMRQIEEGTYKRDVLRAKAAFAGRRSTRPPPAPIEKENEHTVEVDTFEFDSDDFPADAPTRKVDVPAVHAKALELFDPFDEATTNLITRPALAEDEDPTGILPLIEPSSPQKIGGAAPALKTRTLADPEKMRQLAAQIKAKKAAETKEPTPPPRAMTAEAPPIHLGKKPPPLPPRPGVTKPEPPKPTTTAATAATTAAKPAAPVKPATAPLAVPSAAAAATAKPAPPPPAATALGKPLMTKPAAPNPGQKAANPQDLSENRVRQIYTQYVDTKRKQNESTAAITYEGVAKSLRESTARLKEKHGAKAVDFEVTVKDGKTILRPVVKSDGK